MCLLRMTIEGWLTSKVDEYINRPKPFEGPLRFNISTLVQSEVNLFRKDTTNVTNAV